MLTFDIDGSGARAAASFRGSYFHVVTEHDGPSTRNPLERHFESHGCDDPVKFAEMMGGKTILGVYADSDGTLIGKREGYDQTNLFAPPLATSVNKTIEKTGLFTIASAAHIKRGLRLLVKARNQVPLERVLFFAENGYAAIISVKTNRGYEFEIHKVGMPVFVVSWNRKLATALDKLSGLALDSGLFMFVNQDKEAKVTVELLRNGTKANERIVNDLVIPHLVKELGLPKSAVGKSAAGQTLTVQPSPRLTYTLMPTSNSIEIDHTYLTSKEKVNEVMTNLVRLLWARAFGRKKLRDGVFIGIGDSPRGSDSGLLDPLRGNIGLSVRDKSRRVKPTEKLVDIIREDADPPFITLPMFSEDGSVVYGNGDAVVANLNRLFLTGTVFRINDVSEMQMSLRTVLRKQGYSLDSHRAARKAEGMYTFPRYLGRRKDARPLIGRFLRSDNGVNVDKAITAIASRLEIR